MSGSTAMTCRECVEFLMEYLGDELDPAVRSTFELHLDRCPNCVRYLETYAATTRLCKSTCPKRCRRISSRPFSPRCAGARHRTPQVPRHITLVRAAG